MKSGLPCSSSVTRCSSPAARAFDHCGVKLWKACLEGRLDVGEISRARTHKVADVRSWGRSGIIPLVQSITGFDPKETLTFELQDHDRRRHLHSEISANAIQSVVFRLLAVLIP